MSPILARLILSAAILSACASLAQAQNQQPQPPASQAENCLFFIFCQPATSATPETNWRLYHESGTIGRQGLGASPLHPEGPGNASY